MSFYTRSITVTLLNSGLVGRLGYTVSNSSSILIARTTQYVRELSTASYIASIPNWNSAWSGIIEWDVDGLSVFIEEFSTNSTENLLDTATFTQAFNSNAYTYINTRDASFYFDTRLHSEPWDNAIPTDQYKSLCSASRIIDRLNFVGVKANPLQTFQWPRIVGPQSSGLISIGIVPDDILIAVCELAMTLLDGVDPDLEDELLNSHSDAYATVRVTSDPTVARDHVKAGIPSIEAWRHLLPWLQDPRTMHIRKG